MEAKRQSSGIQSIENQSNIYRVSIRPTIEHGVDGDDDGGVDGDDDDDDGVDGDDDDGVDGGC